MGSPRPKPLRLAEKLRYIRTQLGLSQTELLERMGLAVEADLARRPTPQMVSDGVALYRHFG